MTAPPEVYVWHARATDERAGRLWPLLSADEQARAGRFHHAGDRVRFVVGRGMLRALLAPTVGCAAAALRFGYGRRGKPFLETPSPSRLAFNVAHAGTYALVAVGRAGSVGVDVEQVPPSPPDSELLNAVLTPEERGWLGGLDESARAEAFCRCWTLKEACVKATGAGFEISPSSLPVAEAARSGQMLLTLPDAGRWQLRLLPFAPGYCAALATPEAVAAVQLESWQD